MNPSVFRSVSFGVAAVLVAVAVPAAAAPKQRPLYKPGEVIVKFARGTVLANMRAATTRTHAQALVARTMGAVGRPTTTLVRFPAGIPVEMMLARFRGMPDVVYAEPNYVASSSETEPRMSRLGTLRAVRGKDGRATVDKSKAVSPRAAALIDRVRIQAVSFVNDAEVGKQDGWLWMNADIIWPDMVANPMVAVLDTGVDYLHPDLAGRIVKGKDWVNADLDPMDDNGHGTHCAGNVGAGINNLKGIAGVSRAKILAVKVLDAEGFGTTFDIAQGLYDAANNTAVKVISMSLGIPALGSPITLETAVTYALSTKGKLIVAAAGNDSSTTAPFPAAYADAIAFPLLEPQVIAVAASGIVNYYAACADCFFMDYSCMASYSNYGDWISVTAPGTAIFSTTPTKEFWLNYYGGVDKVYGYMDGTSMATPLVAGTAARVFSAMPVGTTASAVKDRIVNTGATAVANGQGSFIDTDGDGATDTECWPSAITTSPTDVNVAAAMYRADVFGKVLDANGALPLVGAQATAVLGTALKGFGGVVDSSGYYDRINVPMNASTNYDVKINKAGYTYGAQKYTSVLVDDCGGGTATVDCVYVNLGEGVEQVSVPKNIPGYWNIVSDWADAAFEIDQYLFTPSLSPNPCDIGYVGLCGTGSLTTAPFARWLHDGGPGAGSGAEEFHAIRSPLYSTATGTPYEIFLTDYTNNGSVISAGSLNVKTRLWKGGIIRGTVVAATGDTSTHDCTIGGGAIDCDAFYVGDLSSAGVFTPRAIYGKFLPSGSDPDGVLPYSRREGTRRGADPRP